MERLPGKTLQAKWGGEGLSKMKSLEMHSNCEVA